MEVPGDGTPVPTCQPLAALALGLASSWMPDERRRVELRAAAAAGACPRAAHATLSALTAADPVAADRALRLLEATFPDLVRSDGEPRRV